MGKAFVGLCFSHTAAVLSDSFHLNQTEGVLTSENICCSIVDGPLARSDM